MNVDLTHRILETLGKAAVVRSSRWPIVSATIAALPRHGEASVAGVGLPSVPFEQGLRETVD